MNNTLVCPFLTDDPLFAQGVEFGMLYSRMKQEEEVEDYFHRSNQEQILLLANRLNWRVLEMQEWDRDWFWLRMRK